MRTLLHFLAPARRVVNFYKDREYFDQLLKIALPITLQAFILNSLNMVATMMIGQLGETAVAAVGLANQVYFLLNLLLFGIASGSAIFTAQLWGVKDIPNIRKVLGLCLKLALAVGTGFLILSEVFPDQVLGIYTEDILVIEAGSQYLRIFGWSFIFFAITFSYAIVLRSIGDVRLPMVVSASALALNTLLSYLLIFGRLGLPTLGIRGAAIGLLISRSLECATLLVITYRKNSPAAARISELLGFDMHFIVKVLKPVLPVAANEFLWSLAITTYMAIYAHIGTNAIAAMNIVSTIDNVALVVFFGVTHATAILVGNRIGAGQEELAFRYAGRSLGLGVMGAFAVGAIILVASPQILTWYQVSPQVIEYAQRVLNIIGLLLWLRVSNMITIVGILRSGGDTIYSLILDGIIIWIVGVPLAAVGAFLLQLPVYWVYLLVMTEELLKFILGFRRFLSHKWIHNLAKTV